MAIEIITVGPMATIQDRGREGYAAGGYRRCGACDKYSMRTANLLAGNPEKGNSDPGCAVIEFTLLGGKLRFTEPTVFALAGARMDAFLDGEAIPLFAARRAQAGQVLELGMAKEGLRTYLAVQGGIDVPPVLGSRSTDVACQIGGLQGRALQAGDYLKTGQAGLRRPVSAAAASFLLRDDLFWLRRASFRYRSMGNELFPVLRIVAGPQEEVFTPEARELLWRQIYRIDTASNRMACRLKGAPLPAKNGYDIVSDGIVEGSVQVSANGLPIVMLADHQTTGGYAKIGTVISADLPAIAQRRPGEGIGFCFVTPEEAREAYCLEEKKLRYLAGQLGLRGAKEVKIRWS